MIMNPARTLLVDDDPTILEAVGSLLSQHGHEVIGTGSGLSGAQFLHGEPFDLAVVDLMLPDFDGLELARQTVAKPDTVVGVLSGSTSVGMAPQAVKMGICDYVPKPFRTEDLERHLILDSLQVTGWNKSESARRLGMRRTTLLHRLRALGIPKDPKGEAESTLIRELP